MATISICAKILSTIASPALKMAYEKGLTIWEAKNALNKLTVSIETIQAILYDAENQQECSAAVRNWIKRLKGVLYDAEDLFDEVLTEDLCKQQMMDGMNKLSLKNKVRVYCSKLNPIVSRNSIAKKVKAIRERLAEISTDMDQFTFVKGQPNTKRSESYTARNYIDAKLVIGRNLYKDSIMKMLFNALPDITDAPIVIALDGIGGMGKTTVAHLIYNDEKVDKFFEKKGFACISESFDDKEVLEKIYQSISQENCCDLTLIQLQEKLRNSLKDKKYLLVLDDVWEDDHEKWTNRKSMLSGANGSRIIVTTRLPSVVSAMRAIGHNLEALSEDESWELFKNLAFAPGYEKDTRRERVGRKLLKKCRGHPLSISCMGRLLYNKTIQEWEEIERVSLPMLKGKQNDKVISILKLSFDYLPFNLKQCFIYCCLFPKDYRYGKDELIYHWIAQGYINLDEEESCFMDLIRMGFFQEVQKDEFGEIKSCKMHDIMHDLALHLSGEESIMQDGTTLNVSSCIRYVSLMVDHEEGELWNIPTTLLDFKLIRSCMLRRLSLKFIQLNLDQLCSNFKMLRTLTLADLRIKDIPPSIGELKLVRYLDLSWNDFERLPDSIANLVNLIILDIHGCRELKVWPLNFKKLINLRSLQLRWTGKLLSMPEGIGEMVSLQHLSDFKVDELSQLHVFTELSKRLRGFLKISFDEGMEVGNDQRWQLPDATSLEYLKIVSYPGHGIWGWGNNASKMILQRLVLEGCKNVNNLPPMSCLPCLKWLEIRGMPELEYIEESEPEELNHRNPATSQEFFPSLEKLKLSGMRKLMGWRRKVADEAASFEFSHLSELVIKYCPNLELKSFPQCPRLRNLDLTEVGTTSAIFLSSSYASLEEIRISECKFLSGIPSQALSSLQLMKIEVCHSLKSLQLASPHLLDLEIYNCDELESIELAQTQSLQSLDISYCDEPVSIELAQTPSLQQLKIIGCHSLKSLQPASLPHLLDLKIDQCGKLESIELAQTKSLKSLHINKCDELESIEFAQTQSLQSLKVKSCWKLESIELAQTPSLESLKIRRCGTLKSLNIGCSLQTNSGLPSTSMSSLRSIIISECKGPITLPWTELTSLESCEIRGIDGLQSVHIPSPHLHRVALDGCVGLTSVEFQALTRIEIKYCSELKNICIAQRTALGEVESYSNIKDCSQLNNVRIPHPIAHTIAYLSFEGCPELSLSTGVDWASLTNLKQLYLHPLPPVEEVLLQLPQCLRQRHALGDLEID